jgi:putative cardiolipin synthase
MLEKPLVIWALLILVTGCASLPDNSDNARSYAIPTDGDHSLEAKLFNQEERKDSTESGVFLLDNGLDAFVARAAFANEANSMGAALNPVAPFIPVTDPPGI